MGYVLGLCRCHTDYTFHPALCACACHRAEVDQHALSYVLRSSSEAQAGAERAKTPPGGAGPEGEPGGGGGVSLSRYASRKISPPPTSDAPIHCHDKQFG